MNNTMDQANELKHAKLTKKLNRLNQQVAHARDMIQQVNQQKTQLETQIAAVQNDLDQTPHYR